MLFANNDIKKYDCASTLERYCFANTKSRLNNARKANIFNELFNIFFENGKTNENAGLKEENDVGLLLVDNEFAIDAKSGRTSCCAGASTG